MKISEVAARSTLRYYEHLGLLIPARSGNGYRNFDDSHLERLGFIDAAKQLGLELPEIRHLLELADTGTCTAVKIVLMECSCQPGCPIPFPDLDTQLDTGSTPRGNSQPSA